MRALLRSWLGGLRAWLPYRVSYERGRWVQPGSEITRAVYGPAMTAAAESPATPKPAEATVTTPATSAGERERGQAA